MFIALAMIGVAVALMVLAAYLFRHPSLRGSTSAGSGMMTAGFDEVFNPHAASARDIVAIETELVEPSPTPDPL